MPQEEYSCRITSCHKGINSFITAHEGVELAGARLFVSSSESLEIANDKSRLYQFLQWRGMDVPDHRIIETVKQFETAAKELGYPRRQFVSTPSVSNGSRGFRIIADIF